MNPVVNVKCNLCNSDDYRIMYPSTIKNIIPINTFDGFMIIATKER